MGCSGGQGWERKLSRGRGREYDLFTGSSRMLISSAATSYCPLGLETNLHDNELIIIGVKSPFEEW